MKTTNETEMVTIGDGFTPEAAKSIGHLKNKQRPNVVQKYRYQCQSLVKKNTILMMRNKISTLAMLLAPAICILLFGLIVIDEKQREMKVISDPKDF